ncbi:MAG TPA: DUF4112 domain-containing protein [Bacteriovoracaceae bacterium]|nr:DUF4112 domain-containing protein [Bacteriovoracaceae bacterium]
MESNNSRDKKLQDIKNLGLVLDSKFIGPFGIRFGLDGVLGFIPFIGDILTTTASVYIIAQAALMGCSTVILLRMGLNVLIENLFDLIPFVGNFFDFFWKANNKNVTLLEAHLQDPRAVAIKSKFVLAGVCVSLILIVIASAYFSYLLLDYLVDILQAAFNT